LNTAIIGAGLAGVVLARRLRAAGHAVTIFEKSRGAGGRMATRRTDAFTFDHGAPCFTAKSAAFRAFLAPHIESGLVARWPGRFVRLSESAAQAVDHERLVALPEMNALCKALAADTPLRTQVQVAPIRQPHELTDSDGNPLGRFDWIVSTAPGPQTASLFAHLARVTLGPEHMTGGFTTMLGFAQAHDPGWDMATVDDQMIASIIRNSAKPGRSGDGSAFVIHTRSDWSEPRIDDPPEAVQPLVMAAFTRITGIDADAVQCATTHRWRYAHANAGLSQRCVFAPEARLAACGDWCWGGGVEAAFRSASALADRLAAQVSD
jgi:predicted NAD/FAD-dependent oxidoreductase